MLLEQFYMKEKNIAVKLVRSHFIIDITYYILILTES